MTKDEIAHVQRIRRLPAAIDTRVASFPAPSATTTSITVTLPDGSQRTFVGSMSNTAPGSAAYVWVGRNATGTLTVAGDDTSMRGVLVGEPSGNYVITSVSPRYQAVTSYNVEQLHRRAADDVVPHNAPPTVAKQREHEFLSRQPR